jgi:spermidine synthase
MASPSPPRGGIDDWAWYRLIWLCFFLSGATGLVYQVVWLRMLGLVFGHTVYAITTVLAAFMAGLALGSFVFARLAPRLRNLVATYGWLEIGIGVYCALMPALLSAAAWVYLGLHSRLGLSYDAFSVVQFALVFLLLLVPTTLMGGTLPVLSQAFVRRELDVGRTVGALYGLNTVGAVVGVVLAGYVLLPAIGNRATLLCAAAANLVVGALALFVARGRRTAVAVDLMPIVTERTGVMGRTGLGARLTVIGLAVSGGVSMIYEVGWTRALALVIGSSTYAFTAMLVAVLVGIAGGSALYSWLAGGRRVSPATFAGLQAGIGLATGTVIYLFPRLPEVFLAGIAWSSSPGAVQLVQLFVSACALLPATLLIGATFPCAVAVVARDLSRVGEDVGEVYAANTLGAIAGAAAGGFIVVPALGVHGALAAGAATNLALAAVLLATTGRRRLATWIPAAAVLVAAVSVIRLSPWDHGLMASGPAVYAQRYVAQRSGGLAAAIQRQTVLFYRDGVSGTVSVHRIDKVTSLRVNGKTDASTGGDMPTQLLSGHLPVLVHPDARNVLVIGMGSGVTAGAVARHPVRRVDVVEIEPAVVEATRFFADVNRDVLKDTRVRVVIADGRNFLLTTEERYDVIISEPSNPWIAGLASLFSREFFELARSRLKPGGLMLQWVQAYNLPPDDLRMVVRTFRSMFPAVSVWNPNQADLLLLGGVTPVAIDPGELARRYTSRPGLPDDLRRLGMRHGAGLVGYLVLGEDDTARLAEGTALNTDDRLPLEFSAPRSLYLDTVGPNLGAIATARRATPSATLEQALDRDGGAPARHAVGLAALARGDEGEARRQFQRALELEPGQVPSTLELANLAYRNQQWLVALQLAQHVLARQDDNARANFLAGIASARLFQKAEAQRFLRRAVALDPGNREYSDALIGSL